MIMMPVQMVEGIKSSSGIIIPGDEGRNFKALDELTNLSEPQGDPAPLLRSYAV